MNHSGLGLIKFSEEKGAYQLFQNPELLSAFGLGQGSTIYGLYYPIPEGANYKKITIRNDIMLTPVPFYLWDRSARLIIHMEQKEGTLKSITNFLQANNVSIINSKSTRSGYRHATYSIYISFIGMPVNLRKFNPKGEYYQDTENKVKKIKQGLEELLKTKDIQYHSDSSRGNSQPVQAWSNNSLAYFHDYVKQKKANKYSSLYEPFDITISYENGLPYLSSPKLDIIINKIRIEENKKFNTQISEEKYTAITFAELDTRTLNMRMAVIPEKRAGNFFEIGIEYVRNGNLQDGKGLIAAITKKFPKEFNLWRSYNYTKINTEDYEKGAIVFLIEDISDKNFGREDGCLERAKSVIEYTIKPALKKSHKKVVISDKYEFNSLTNLNIKRIVSKAKERKKSYKESVFISYAEGDMEHALIIENMFQKYGIDSFHYKKDIKISENIPGKIKEALNECIEMCLIFTKNSQNKEWVLTEWGAVWAMEKKITPILIGKTIEQLPLRLRNDRCVVVEKKNIKNINRDRGLEEYVKQLSERIKERQDESNPNKFRDF